uniref:Interleukin-12 subunit beta n=1 Tax=Periophthalmus magnuspinnatus TaxID=409849 RepID=A0A3B4B8Q4_9GOBI
MYFLFLTLWSFLRMASLNPTNVWILRDNVLEVTGGAGQHLLRCIHSEDEVSRRPDEGAGIFWKRNGVKIPSVGNVLTVALKETSGRGNYSCHDEDGSFLNHTEVLILEDNGKKMRILEPDHINCSAPNYNGRFQCFWTWDSLRVGKVALVRVGRHNDPNDLRCSEDAEGKQWTCVSSTSNISCSVDPSGNSVSCIDDQQCPYAEEVNVIRITVYLVYDSLLENYSKSFYLSEIVKPGNVRITKVNKKAIEWTYPESWASPNSYFPLTFEIAQLSKRSSCDFLKHQDKNQKVKHCWAKLNRRTTTVCFRAKDALSNSEWSEWSPERSVLMPLRLLYMFYTQSHI